jgi:hypothetical protein
MRMVEAAPPGLELRNCALRICHAIRLQAALLVRLQNKLRVLANMLAGPGLTYGPPPPIRRMLPGTFAGGRRA